MQRKSALVTLGILGAAAALGSACCCCINWVDDQERQDDRVADEKAKDGGGGGGHAVRTRYRPPLFVPIFWGGGTRYTSGPARTTSAPGSPRGGFGATATSHSSPGA